jgi:hypothetical protein
MGLPHGRLGEPVSMLVFEDFKGTSLGTASHGDSLLAARDDDHFGVAKEP